MVTDAVDVPDDRHRRRAATATARCSCSTTCSASRTASRPKFVRRYADAEGRRGRRRRARFADDVRAGRSRPTTRATTSSTTVAEALGLYGAAAPSRVPGDRRRAGDARRAASAGGSSVGAGRSVGRGCSSASVDRRPRLAAGPRCGRRRAARSRPTRRSPGSASVRSPIEPDGGRRLHVRACLLAATAAQQRARGPDGRSPTRPGRLRRRWCSCTTRTRRRGFWMRNTPMPLSIAWSSTPTGRLVSTTDMAPCGDRAGLPALPGRRARTATPSRCPQGRLDDLGLTGAARDGGSAAAGRAATDGLPEGGANLSHARETLDGNRPRPPASVTRSIRTLPRTVRGPGAAGSRGR